MKKFLMWILIITLLFSQLTTVFANKQREKKYYTISGEVTGLPNCEGIEVNYTVNGEAQSSTSTDVDGIYIIENIQRGATVVIIPTEQNGYTPSANIEIENICKNKTEKDIIYRLNEYTISGEVTGLPECGTIEVKYTLDDVPRESVYTQGDGTYTIQNILHGSNIVIIPSVQAGYTPSAEITITDISGSQTEKNIVYAINKYSLSGQVEGLAFNGGVAVYYKINDGETKSVTTSAGGYYTIKDIPYGSDVEITPSVQEGYTVSGAITTENVTYSKAIDRITYTIKRFTISGTIAGLPDAEGITLNYTVNGSSSGAAIVDQDWEYTIDNVPYGAAVVITPRSVTGYSVLPVTIDSVTDTVIDITITYNVKSYTLSFCDGTTTTEPQNYNYGQSIILPENMFTPPANMEFKEWNERSNGRGDDYQPGGVYVMGASDITLYAVWQYVTPVKPPSGGGGGGGGSSTPAEQPKPVRPTLTIVGMDEYDAVIYQDITEVEEGTQRTVKAPQVRGYHLVDEESKKITIRTGDNKVTFKFAIDRAVTLNKQDHIKYIDGYSDGEMKPERGVTRAEVAVILFRLAVGEDKNTPIPNAFRDISDGAWYAQEVNYLAKNGIILGYENGEFRPDAIISRAEFTAIAARLEKLEQSSLDLFKDVSTSYWAYSYINSAALKGWVTGFPDGTFRPGDGITRAQIIAIVNRMLERKIHAVDIPANAKGFKDVPKDYWGYADIMEATTTHQHSFNEDGYETWR